MWEVLEEGKLPFGEFTNADVIKEVVDKKNVLPIPQDCPDNLYNIMKRCWRTEATQRPSFKELVDLFDLELGNARKEEIEMDNHQANSVTLQAVSSALYENTGNPSRPTYSVVV